MEILTLNTTEGEAYREEMPHTHGCAKTDREEFPTATEDHLPCNQGVLRRPPHAC